MKTFVLCLAFAALTLSAQSSELTVGSFRPPGSSSAAGGSFLPQFSRDGNHLIFVSQAHNLVTNHPPSPALNVFRRDINASNTVLVSVSTGGIAANDDANHPVVSSNAQLIAFTSRASNLAPGDTNSAQDIFVRDSVRGTTSIASVAFDGQTPAEPGQGRNRPLSDNPMISSDGRFVVFESRATNLVTANVSVGSVLVYRRDLWSNTTEIVSADSAGIPATGITELVAISDDGRYVAFATTNVLSDEATGASSELYLRDHLTGTLVTATAGLNTITNLGAYRPVSAIITATSVWFSASGSSKSGVFEFDLVAKQLRLVAGSAGPGLEVVNISDDQRYLMYSDQFRGGIRFETASGNTIDLTQGPCACANSAGTNCVMFPSMSANGRYVSYLWLTDCGTAQVVWRDLESPLTNNIGPVGIHEAPVLSRSGLQLAFATPSRSIINNDNNAASDVFLHDRNTDVTELISAAHLARMSINSPRPSVNSTMSISDDGRYVAFVRPDDPSVFRDTNRLGDAFIADLQSGTVRAATIDTNLYVSETGGPAYYVDNTHRMTSAIISGDGSRVAGLAHNTSASALEAVLCGIGGATTTIPIVNSPSVSSISLSVNGRLLLFSTPGYPHYPINGPGNTWDVFLRNENGSAPTNFVISGIDPGTTGAADSKYPVLSRDSRWVVFATLSQNLIPGRTGVFSAFQVVAADLGTNENDSAFGFDPPKRLVSYESDGSSLTNHVTNAVISANSRYVVFAPTNGSAVYRHDLLSSNTPNVLVATNGRQPSVSENGNVIAFERVRGDGVTEIVAADISAGTESILSVGRSGQSANGSSTGPAISADGRYVVFGSKASNLVASDTNGTSDIFVHDRQLGVTLLLSANAAGQSGNGLSSGHALSADGRTVVFRSFASDLVDGDYNETRDIFVAKLGSGDSDNDGLDDDWELAYFGNLARNGSGDFDADGLSDRDEFLTATDPTNSGSVFRVTTLATLGGGSRQVIWSGVPSHTYRVEYKDDLNEVGWSTLDTPVTWNGNTANAIDSAAATNRFYRVVKLP